ncbi:DUF4345 family protein [Adhaeribacter radiodurans]|uniref:DUF4345 family protein n=1 Tax=Adhaeribacter radiodurans TaxID=2745197 RepID=A0A7L7LAM0_9BACT|nr:DUF4345 family protein [Adhaeribacter radiodurans]QMU29882.1 DUF4345 family protein [Adhaeribacter radiodurans]
MKFLAYFFFYTYVGLLLLAGIWGAFGAARLDQELLFQFNVKQVNATTAASILTQYRFLRLLEFGFGLFAIQFRKEIFSITPFNRLFTGIMFLGALVRVLSYFADGPPLWIFYFFATYEMAGVLLIFLYTRHKLLPYNG